MKLLIMNCIKKTLTELEALEREAEKIGLRLLIEAHTKDGVRSYTPIFIEKEKE